MKRYIITRYKISIISYTAVHQAPVHTCLMRT